MATLNTLLVNADSVNGPRNWTTQGFASIDEGIASADAAAIREDSNNNITLDTSFLLSDVNADLGNVDTLSWQVRYRVVGAQTNSRSLHIRIVTESGGVVLAGADSGGSFQQIAANITTTSFVNSSVTGFTFENTTATKAQWNDARVEIRLIVVKSMGGDTNGVEVDTLQITGTYTEGAPGPSPITGSTAGTSSITSTLIGIGELTSSTSGVASISATLVGFGELTGQATGVGTASGTLGEAATTDPISGATDGAAAASGILHGIGTLDGVITGVSSGVAILQANGTLIGSVSGNTALSGILRGRGFLSGQAGGAGALSGLFMGSQVQYKKKKHGRILLGFRI